MRRSESLPEQVYNFSLSQRKLDDFFCEDGDSLPELHHQIAAWLVTPRFLPSHGLCGSYSNIRPRHYFRIANYAPRNVAFLSLQAGLRS